MITINNSENTYFRPSLGSVLKLGAALTPKLRLDTVEH
jgi:hypothetical protein